MESNGSSALAVVGQSPSNAVVPYHDRAVQAANFVREIVLKRAVQISGRRYVPTEAYQAIANAMGCVASARDVRKVDGGWVAHGEVKRLSDGKVLAEGEGFVGNDEPKWAKGPEYAARSMVQTRAIGRACRAAFAFVVPMIDLNLQPTPAEELEGVNTGSENPPPPAPVRGNAAVKAALRPSPPKPQNEPPPHEDADFRPDAAPSRPAHIPTSPPTHNRERSFKFGRNANTPLHALDEGSLKFYQGALQRDLASDDPKKRQYADSNRAALADVEGELAYRGL